MAAPIFIAGDNPTAAQINTWFVNIGFAYKATQTGRASTTTLADDPDLTLPVVANAIYLAKILLRHNSQPAGDFKWTMLGPSGASFDHVGGTIIATGSVFTDDQEFTAQLGDVFSSAGIAGINTPIRLEGLLITAGTAGNFKLQWAQVTSNVGNSTLLANSFMLLRRVG